MDSPPPASASTPIKGIRIWIIIAAGCLILLMVALVASYKTTPKANFVWLDQRQFASQMQPGRFKMLYYKFVHLTGPVWQHFRRPKTQIHIASKFLAVRGVTTSELGIGTAMATNETGAQVWIFSPSELGDLRQRLKTASGIEVMNAPSVVTVGGQPASLAAGHPHPKTSAWIGVTLNVDPKVVSHQLQLVMSANYTESSDDTPTASIRTNLSAACRVQLPNAGGVMIADPESRDLNRTNYWLLLSATAIDGLGNPIKL
jgi:type IV secretory pathway VirJ component